MNYIVKEPGPGSELPYLGLNWLVMRVSDDDTVAVCCDKADADRICSLLNKDSETP